MKRILTSLKKVKTLIRRKCTPLYQKALQEAIGLTRDNIKRRAFHLRHLIDHIKNKKAKKKVIAEYVRLIQKMSVNN